MTPGTLWNYYGDNMNDAVDEDVANYRINNNKITTSKSLEYNSKIIGSTLVSINLLDAEVFILLKHFSIFWRNLDLSLTEK